MLLYIILLSCSYGWGKTKITPQELTPREDRRGNPSCDTCGGTGYVRCSLCNGTRKLLQTETILKFFSHGPRFISYAYASRCYPLEGCPVCNPDVRIFVI